MPELTEDLNQLFEYDEHPRIGYMQPRYWPYAPQHAPAFEVYRCNAAIHGPFTTLNTYVAPAPPQWQQYYAQKAAQGNGVVMWGNAPYKGVYTGVQEE